ncbi:hypothetical protein MCOR29_011147 [Pyricularia oryzae]|nr:hypothetical protein MCOR01_006961 [Pyricularia oryzae]KAI6297679.1 hypothetical protein MCOR29_011147 [Pyricularia oryzae]KAI6467444.1 hypothetical protein MCOR15_002576 [Pyricularia oryzae]KAI6524276.1 hypothetical protein MCOR05_009815 [Pyricularia oryzae]KAI6589361.1 hypothetical protein MCOR12_008787 [Pyricularia oryzae]
MSTNKPSKQYQQTLCHRQGSPARLQVRGVGVPEHKNKTTTTTTMAGKYYSPYAPRGRTNNTLVMVWVGGFLTLLFMTYWISTRHADKARHYADKFAHPPMPQ